ncbi:MAG: 50S ribosomal protein L11 methyltransferase, partial [Thermoanaerobaculia bacterium]|nr:50S ribosomal protein L11 methyltransferase [Thermoanaerobaculia bacterium]
HPAMSVYSIIDYGRMLQDEARTGAYVEALERHVTSDSVVLDLGPGIGFFAVVAARLGARRVYGIDRSELVEIGRQIAARNGVADRVELIRGDSLELEMPQRADLMVCDVRGILPWGLGSVPAVIDARRRLLTDGAVILPRRDFLYAAVTEQAEDYGEQTAVWRERPFEVDIEPGRDLVVNLRRRVRILPEQLLGRPAEVARLDYATVDSSDMAGSVELAIERSATAHGLAVWFDCEVHDDLGFSNRPGNELVYKQVLFPWSEPVALEAGDRVAVDLAADFVNGEYVWRWSSRVERDGRVLDEFRQSNFFGVFPSRESRAARSAEHRPGLSKRGEAVVAALERMRSGDDLARIAALLVERFPELFETVGQAQGFAGELSIRYGRPIG